MTDQLLLSLFAKVKMCKRHFRPTFRDDAAGSDHFQRNIDYIVKRYLFMLESFADDYPLLVRTKFCRFDPGTGLKPLHVRRYPNMGDVVLDLLTSVHTALGSPVNKIHDLESEIDDPVAVERPQCSANDDRGRRAEWDQVRPIVSGLYIQQDLKLKDIRRIMADRYNHRAT